MPAAPRISTQEIVNALLTWRGDIAATARALGMARNSLYERCRRLGLDIEGFRAQGVGNPVTPITTSSGVRGMTGIPSSARDARKTAGAIYPSGERARKVTPVQQASNAAAVESEAVPIKTAPKRRQPICVKPEQRDALQRAAWDLQARYQAETNENLILEQFIEEAFASWLNSKLGQPAAIRRKRAEKGGSE